MTKTAIAPTVISADDLVFLRILKFAIAIKRDTNINVIEPNSKMSSSPPTIISIEEKAAIVRTET